MAFNSKSIPTSPNLQTTTYHFVQKRKILKRSACERKTIKGSIHVFKQEGNQCGLSLLAFSYRKLKKKTKTQLAAARLQSRKSLFGLFGLWKGYVALATHGRVALILRMNGSDRMGCKVLMFQPIYHVSRYLTRVFLCPCVGPFPSVGLTLTWYMG